MSINVSNLPNGFSWVAASHGAIPPSAVVAGKEKSGETLYIARIHEGNTVHVGKCGSHLRGAISAYDGREQFYNNYEVLCGRSSQLKWVEHNGAFDPTKIIGSPIVGGTDSSGATLFITRAKTGYTDDSNFAGSAIPIGVQPGKISSLMSGASACAGGREYTSKQYEVLVYYYEGYSWVQTSNGNIPSNALPTGRENDSRGALYTARGFMASSPNSASLQVGKAASHLGGGSFPFNYAEVFLSNVEVFAGPSSGVSWVSQSGRFNPANVTGQLVLGGIDADGAVLYIARAAYSGGTQPGKVSVNIPDGAHFSADHGEHGAQNYEVLVYN